jgi:hypothetical protein
MRRKCDLVSGLKMQIAVSQISVDARNNEVVKPNIGYKRRMAIISLMKPILRNPHEYFPFPSPAALSRLGCDGIAPYWYGKATHGPGLIT